MQKSFETESKLDEEKWVAGRKRREGVQRLLKFKTIFFPLGSKVVKGASWFKTFLRLSFLIKFSTNFLDRYCGRGFFSERPAKMFY